MPPFQGLQTQQTVILPTVYHSRPGLDMAEAANSPCKAAHAAAQNPAKGTALRTNILKNGKPVKRLDG
jgi:hypothetical protein